MTPSRKVLMLAAVVACSGDPVGQSDPQLTLPADEISLSVGATSVVLATVRNTDAEAEFVSRNVDVATVNDDGAVKGIAVGETYVVASLSTAADVRDSVRVVVQAPAVSCPLARPDFGPPATAADRALFAYDVNAPLDLQQTPVTTVNGVRTYSISYVSPDGGSVTGIMTEPVNAIGPRPGMVLLPPSGGGATGMTPYAQMLAAHGAVAIAINAPYVRRGGTSLPVFTIQDRLEQIQLIKDLQRAVDVLRARADVDPARIGFEGYSYGGILGAQFIGIERRLKAAVLAAAMGGNVTGATTQGNLNWLAANVPCPGRATWFEAMVPIEPIRYISNAAPTEVLFQVAQFDMAVLLDDAMTLYDAASEPKELRLYPTGHGFNAQVLTERHQWWHEKLGIDPPA